MPSLSATCGGTLPRSVPDAHRGQIYEFAKDGRPSARPEIGWRLTGAGATIE
jgi:hypothetical protein